MTPRPALVPAVLEGTAPAWPEVDAYLGQLPNRNTRAAYSRHLEAFRVRCACNLAEVRPGHLAAFRGSVMAQGGAPASQAQAITAVRSFFKWAVLMEAAPPLPLDLLKPPRGSVQRPYTILSEAEMAAAVAQATSLRDRAILALFLGAALRVSELVALDVGDLGEDGRGLPLVTVRHGKGDKARQVPLYDWTARAVGEYVQGRTDGPLLLAEDRAAGSRGDLRLTRGGCWALIRRLCSRAGILRAVSPHALRHSAAMRHLRAGGNVESLRRILGHSRLQTTMTYLDHLGLGDLLAPAPPPAGF